MVGGTTVRNLVTLRKTLSSVCIKFNEWSSFHELDCFDPECLIAALTTDKNCGTGRPLLWTKFPLATNGRKRELPIAALRQAEAIFNLSQLMFALYHGSVSACTFRDLQLNQPPRDIRKHGFNKLGNCSLYSGTTFRQALHVLCWEITEKGGLPVIFSMMKNPQLPIIRQKCLDALTNVLCVDTIEKLVLERQPWFLEMLIKMVGFGDLQCDMVPAISVLDRLVVVILSEGMSDPYKQLFRLDFIETCLSRLQHPAFTKPNLHLHFVKFQTIAMQAVALLCANEQSSQWTRDLQDLVFQYAFHSVLLWDTDKPPSDPVWHQSESFYRSMSFSSSALVFSFVVLVHAVLKWPGKFNYLKKQALAFKYQLSKILTLHGSDSGANMDVNTPTILNAVEWLWYTLYSQDTPGFGTSSLCASVLEPLPELCEKVLRYCSNERCSKKEGQVNQFETCVHCRITCYCSDACRVAHVSSGHRAERCDFLKMDAASLENGEFTGIEAMVTIGSACGANSKC